MSVSDFFDLGSAPGISVQQKIRFEKVRQFFIHGKGNGINLFFAVAPMVWILRASETPWTTIEMWFLVFATLSLSTHFYGHYMIKTGLTQGNCEHAMRIRVTLGSLMTASCGMACFLPGQPRSHELDTYFFLILTTISTIVAMSFAIIPAYYTFVIFLCMEPFTVYFGMRYWFGGDSFYLIAVMASLLWQAIIISKARRLAQTDHEAIVLGVQLREEIAEKERVSAIVKHLSLVDELTGLGNRRHFNQSLKNTLLTAQRKDVGFGLITLDLNDFKPINDRFGHAAGDAVLHAIGKRLDQTSRAGDFCARTGGDEFYIIVNDVHLDDEMQRIAQKFAEAVQQPIEFEGRMLKVTASLGWAIYPEHGTHAEQLMKVADERMYRIKKAGKVRGDHQQSTQFCL